MLLANHAHLSFFTQHYLLLSLTSSFPRIVYEAVKLSSITFRIRVRLKAHKDMEWIAAAILAQADYLC